MEIREDFYGKTLHVTPEFDAGVEPDIAEWFEKYYSVRYQNYPVGESYLHDRQEIPCG